MVICHLPVVPVARSVALSVDFCRTFSLSARIHTDRLLVRQLDVFTYSVNYCYYK